MTPTQKSSTQEVLAGLVERVTFHNAENGFCVLRAKARGHRDLVTVVDMPRRSPPVKVLSRELGFGRTKSVGLGSSSGSRRCLPILERFASEGAERVAGNKMALNVERVMDDGVNG